MNEPFEYNCITTANFRIIKLEAELAALREENDKLRAYGVADPRDIDTALEALADQIPACINSLHSWLRCVRRWNTCVENVPQKTIGE